MTIEMLGLLLAAFVIIIAGASWARKRRRNRGD